MNCKIYKTDLFILLIKNYQEEILKSIKIFKKYLDLNSPCEWEKKGLESNNSFGPKDNYYYIFNKAGCHFNFGEIKLSNGTRARENTIDYSFGPDGMVGGINFSNLVLFVCDRNNFFDEFKNEKNFRDIVIMAIKSGVLSKPFENRNLFYVTKKYQNKYPFLHRWIDPHDYTKKTLIKISKNSN